jgi:hypothetical protein
MEGEFIEVWEIKETLIRLKLLMVKMRMSKMEIKRSQKKRKSLERSRNSLSIKGKLMFKILLLRLLSRL